MVINPRPVLSALVLLYAIVAAGTIVTLAVMSALDAPGATIEAWVHAVIVGAFALVLPLRERAARKRSAAAARAVVIIAVVLVVVNAVEAAIPVFPVWMRVEMVGIALLLAAVAVLGMRRLRAPSRGTGATRIMES